MIEATVYVLSISGIDHRTTMFDCTSSNFEKHLTSIYGKDNMENVQWDIWEPAEEEGFEEVEELETEVGKYLKKRLTKR